MRRHQLLTDPDRPQDDSVRRILTYAESGLVAGSVIFRLCYSGVPSQLIEWLQGHTDVTHHTHFADEHEPEDAENPRLGSDVLVKLGEAPVDEIRTRVEQFIDDAERVIGAILRRVGSSTPQYGITRFTPSPR